MPTSPPVPTRYAKNGNVHLACQVHGEGPRDRFQDRGVHALKGVPEEWRLFAVAAALAVLALGPGAQARIPLELRFDGQALDPTAPPDFTCFNDTRARWTSCRVQKASGPGAYVLERPEPGKYRMHVSIDENPANPRRYPGAAIIGTPPAGAAPTLTSEESTHAGLDRERDRRDDERSR